MDNELIIYALTALAVILLFYAGYRVFRILRWRLSTFRRIDEMSGLDFEKYLKVKFEELGYEVVLTNGSRDFGADLILSKDGEKTVVQAKRYEEKVSVPAVQQVFTAMYYYEADKCMVVTNNYFTEPCIKLAEKVGVMLIDRDGMEELFDIK